MKYILIATVGISTLILFLKYYPPFGRKPNREATLEYKKSANFLEGKFANQIPTAMGMKFKDMIGLIRDFIQAKSKVRPSSPVPVESLHSDFFKNNKLNKIIWFGHSTILLTINEKVLLLDPMFGRSPSPFPAFGGKRFSEKLPMEIKGLPKIDAVLISHDHYDHLDYDSIKQLEDKVRIFFVPLGVGGHLEKWGIEKKRIIELDWWDEFEFEGLTFACAPTRHFSGRSITDRNSTLWSSWAIIGKDVKVYFSGDGGYGPHFKEIGEKYGPFDVTLMECGQYDERWSSIHMTPEETAQAHLDVKGKLLIPIHWAAFTLSLHEWTDPIERVTKAAKNLGFQVSTPKIGEPVIMNSKDYPSSTWWKL